MLPQSGISAADRHRTSGRGGESADDLRLSIDIRRFPWIRRLAADYAYDFSRVAEFFSGDPATPHAWRDAIARTQRYARDRGAIADLVQAQQHRRGAPPEALAAAGRLREADTVAIVTGQQAGLFGGPLFTLLKALTAIRLAEQVRDEHGAPAVAVFWIDAEDHDWDEVKSSAVLDAELNLRVVSAGDPPGAHEGPIARVRLDDQIVAATAAVEAALPSTEFTPQVLDTLRDAYRPGAGMADAFGRWLEAVLGPRGLVVYDAADPSAKPLAARVFAREIEHAGQTSTLAAEAGEALEARGYHTQVTPHADGVSVFHLNRLREPIRRSGDAFLVGDRATSRAELLAAAREHPEQFSPNVLLRPIVQDTLFPTACYVAGPNELAYLAQLGRVYDAFGVPMPLIQQRATVTVVDSNAMKFLTRHDFPFESLRAQDEAALNELLQSQLPPTIEASLQDAVRTIDERMAALAGEVAGLDATLEGAARSALSRMQDDLKKLQGKIIQAAKRKNETLRRQYHHAQAQAFPGGHPQERQVACIHFLNRYGPALVDRLGDELPLDMGIHWVVTI